MANISEAEGRFKMLGADALNKEQIQQILNMIKLELENIEYNTCLHCNLTHEEPDALSFINDNYESSFFGSGRWYYEHNIKSIFEWLMYSWNVTKRHLEMNKCYINIINLMIEKNIQFKFEYYDYEAGQAPETIFKEQLIVRPYYESEDNDYHTEVLEFDSEDYVATGNRMVEFNYIEDFYTLEEIQNNEVELFYSDEQKQYWLEEEDNITCFEDGKYVYSPDMDMFFLA